MIHMRFNATECLRYVVKWRQSAKSENESKKRRKQKSALNG